MADRAALLQEFIDNLRDSEARLERLMRQAADLQLPIDERFDLRVARYHIESVRAWRERMEGRHD